ncbi:MAG: phosphoribosylaminoimidazolesuccinocarboxamide synthase, partial [Deltaproteobacteria bacterium]|nr:phosphoribosylaminoimidazolesuccinocarboxamide synthase [Deltaproteobacteria bacterium]
LKQGDRLAQPLFTPTTKAEVGEHDLPMTFDEVVKAIGAEWAEKMRSAALQIFNQASMKAEKQGLILVDTKMEFGVDHNQLILIDELLTPDASRFWLKSEYQPGKPLNPWDKQLVRDYLLNSTWDRKSPPPLLPQEIIQETLYRYRSIAERLTQVNL